MEPQLQRVEIQALARGDDHDLAVDHAVLRQALEQRIVQLGKVAVERPRVAALDVHARAAAEHDGAEAVPLRPQKINSAGGSSSASFASIGSIGGYPLIYDMAMQREDQRLIEQIVERWREAWNDHDMARMATLVSDDADFVNVWGMHWHGRERIEREHAERHRTQFKDSIWTTREVKLQFLRPRWRWSICTGR